MFKWVVFYWKKNSKPMKTKKNGMLSTLSRHFFLSGTINYGSHAVALVKVESLIQETLATD